MTETVDRSTLAGRVERATVGLSQLARLFVTGGDFTSVSAPEAQLAGPADPFRQSIWVNRCIAVKATNAARVPLRLSRKEASGTRSVWGFKHVRCGSVKGRATARYDKAAREGEIIEAGDLYDFLARPNRWQRFGSFLQDTVVKLDSAGRVHWLFDELTGRRPGAMVAISGRASEPVAERAGLYSALMGWRIAGPDSVKRPVALDDVVTWTYPDSAEPWNGLAPRQPALLSIVGDYNASLFNAAAFGNGCEPGTVLETDAAFDPDRNAEMRAAWRQRHAGPMNAHGLAILWGGMKLKEHSQTLTEMVYPQGKQLYREEICAAYGVPMSVAGFLAGSTDANSYATAELKRFWQDTEAPLLEMIAEAINAEICPRFDATLEAWFDLESVPVFQEMRLSQTDTVHRYWQMGVPLADLNEWSDLGLPDRPQHARGWLSQGMVTTDALLSEESNPPPPLDETPPPAGSDSIGQPPARSTVPAIPAEEKALADRLWAAWARSWAPLAASTRRYLAGRFAAQGRVAESILSEQAKAAKDDSLVARVLSALFDDADERRKFRLRMTDFALQAARLGIRQALAEAGLAGAKLDEAVKRLTSLPRIREALAQDVVRITTRVDAATRQQMRNSLQEGLAAGEDVRHLTDRVQGLMANRRAGAMMIARNSVGQAMSMARYEGTLESGATHEIWIHSRSGGERRPGHVAAEAHYRLMPKPVGAPWRIVMPAGGVTELRFPRDPLGPPGEIINCQCLTIAKVLTKQQAADPNIRKALMLSALRAEFIAFQESRDVA